MNKKNRSLTAHSCMAILLATVFTGVHVGCVTSVSRKVEAPQPPSQAGVAAGQYKVIFGTKKGKRPEIFDGFINGNLTVQDALQSSGALDKFRKGMRVDLARRLENGHVLKLPVNYNSETRQVMDEQNYAIHPGDEILVRREDEGMLHEVFANMKTPF